MRPAAPETPPDYDAPRIIERPDGFYWQDISVGQRFQTFRRTVTETDLVNFINTTGMLEAIFIEEGYEHGAIKGRPVPANRDSLTKRRGRRA